MKGFFHHSKELSYLRTPVGDERFNYLMVLNVEKEEVNNINL